MSSCTMSLTLNRPFDETVNAVREQLSAVGLEIFTELDLQATLKRKLDVDVAPQVIIGAHRPQLAHRTIGVEPLRTPFLPCDVVVRALAEFTTIVEAFDPEIMTSHRLCGADGPADAEIRAVATDARKRLCAALAAVGRTPAGLKPV